MSFKTLPALCLSVLLGTAFPILLRPHMVNVDGRSSPATIKPSPSAGSKAATDSSEVRKQRIVATYAQLPLTFEANRGQTDGQVQFLSRGRDYTLFLSSNEANLALKNPQTEKHPENQLADLRYAPQPTRFNNLRMRLMGANPAPDIHGGDELSSKSNYFIGSDPRKWRTNVPNYAKVKYRGVYPGIDLVYYGKGHQLEHDFIVSPGADPHAIALSFDGAQRLAIDAQGDLVLSTEGGEVRMKKPTAYQQTGDTQHEVSARYRLRHRNEAQFELAAYDTTKPLVIDPVLIYSTYLGGSQDDLGHGIAVDSSGSAYVVGTSESSDFPTTTGAFQVAKGFGGTAFIAKLNATGTSLIYSTYLGSDTATVTGIGTGGSAIAVDAAGDAYITGVSGGNLPVTPGALQSNFGGGNIDAFITKLNSTGSSLVYSTYLGGNFNDEGNSITVDSAGNAYIAGDTSGGFPTTPGAFQTTFGGNTQTGSDANAFVAKVNSSGSALIYSTYLGGHNLNAAFGIVVDSQGRACVTGFTEGEFPITPGASQTAFGGGRDAFVTKLSADGSSLLFSTFLGGSGNEEGLGIAMDSASNVYVTGWTIFGGFPTTPGAYQTTPGGNQNLLFKDAFITKLGADGSSRIYSTYLGGDGDDQGFSIAVNSAGAAVLTGQAGFDFPVTSGSLQTTFGGGATDAFIAKLSGDGSSLLYSTYLGGSGDDIGVSLALDSVGGIYLTGATSGGFPTTPGAFQRTFGGGLGDLTGDAFVAKIGNSPQTEIEVLEQSVKSLVDAGVFGKGQANSLLVKLQKALKELNVHNDTAAKQALRTFVSEVESLANDGVLTALQAQALIDAANNIIAVL